MLNKFRNNDKGFTLVELMMVIVILGVLAGVAVPMVGRMRKNAVAAKMGSYADSLGTAIIMEQMGNPDFDISTNLDDVDGLVSFQGDNVVIASTAPGAATSDDIKTLQVVYRAAVEASGSGEGATPATPAGFTIQAYQGNDTTGLFTSAKSFDFPN